MSPADALRALIQQVLPTWRIQFGRWNDDPQQGGTYRYVVIRPVGGLPVSLVREPQFTITFIAALADVSTAPHAAAEQIIQAMQDSAGGLVSMQPSEPVASNTDDGRAVAELAVSTIVNV